MNTPFWLPGIWQIFFYHFFANQADAMLLCRELVARALLLQIFLALRAVIPAAGFLSSSASVQGMRVGRGVDFYALQRRQAGPQGRNQHPHRSQHVGRLRATIQEDQEKGLLWTVYNADAIRGV